MSTSPQSPDFRDIGDLKGQAAVISGSTSGIGLALARAVATRGGDVVLNGLGDPAEIERTRAALEASSGVRVRYHPADMTRGEEVADMVAFAEREFGRLDILVNNAGVQHVESVEKFPTDKWEQIIAINLSSAFYATRAAIPIMKAQGRGRIVNMASAHGLVASPFKSAYVAAKHGVIGFTKTAAKELARFGVTVNAISPSAETRMIASIPPDRRRELEAMIPLGRFAEASEMCSAVAFLASQSAGYITGVVLPIDGGISM